MISRDDVIAAYRLFLGRDPESEDVVAFHMKSPSREALSVTMMRSPEFVARFKAATTTIDYVPVEQVFHPRGEVRLDASRGERAAV